MATSKERANEHGKGRVAMNTPPIVSQQEWEAARQQLLVKEKALTRSRDALAAERRRMPWLAVDKKYEFDGPKGKVGLLDLFESRPQLILYRAFFEPGVFGWPEHACRGCSLGADQVAHLAHLNARGDEAMGTTWSYLDLTPLGRQETWEDSPEGYPQTPPYKWWNWHDNYDAEALPNPKWLDIITDPQGAAE